MPTFLLDPRVLDDCVSDSAPDAKIVAEGVGCFSGWPREYVFFFDYEQEQRLPKELMHLASLNKSEHIGYTNDIATIYTFSKALIFVMPANAAYFDKELKPLYAFGKFLKGDAEMLKNYGVKIKSF